ncbi:PQQ-binding-like beta-propeller repeat protein [Haladaptatus sp. T7]|uniref:outer membrane protein assembly factor BamB family protein n=1 Tax=Haladaptatus sp. T7 TaxID=2029368 RepID=UPI00223009D4|nr:PQQ-binding-like beta-propeller repeat protein [Haladaptatus sp. T7]
MERITRRTFLQTTGAATGAMLLSSGTGGATSPSEAEGVFAPENSWSTPLGTAGKTRATHAAGPAGPYLRSRWRDGPSGYFSGDSDSQSPVVANGIAYLSITENVGTTDGAVIAYDVASGEQLWKLDKLPAESQLSSESQAGGQLGRPNSQPIISDGSVYISCSGKVPPYEHKGHVGIYSVDATTGEIQWRRADLGTPVIEVANDRVYFGGGALDAATGQSIWEIEGEDRLIGVAGGTLYTISWCSTVSTTEIIARDATTGTKQWRVEKSLDQPVGTAITTDAIYVTSRSHEEEPSLTVSALSTVDGSILWRSPAPARGTAPTTEYGTERDTYTVERNPYISVPAVDESRLYVLTRSYTDDIFDPVYESQGEYFDSHSTLYAFDRVSGNELWRFETPAQVEAAPTVTDDTIYFASKYHESFDDSEPSWGTPAIYALDTETGSKKWVSAINAESDAYLTPPTIVNRDVFIATIEIGDFYPDLYALESTQCGESIPDDGSETVRNSSDNKLNRRAPSGSNAIQQKPDIYSGDVEPLVSQDSHIANVVSTPPTADHSLLSIRDRSWHSPLAFIGGLGASLGAYLNNRSPLK